MPGKRRKHKFADLVRIMARLRGPGGCPWDRKQNHKSLLPYLVEEAHEVVDAIERRNMEALREELGDLLLQIVFHAELAAERGRFTIDDVTDSICRKLIGRHPHVFGGTKLRGADAVLHNWERIKLNEKATSKRSVLDGVPRGLPSLLKAYRLQEKTARFGFDWDEPRPVVDKVHKEVDELTEAVAKGVKREIEHEIGDLLFSLVNLARHLKIDPERALDKTNRRFTQRFQYIERQLPKTGRALGEASLEELDALWEEAKRKRR